ncbi:TPM domain-containing protein [Kordia sp.]|uniref:TPM domain-containing protein n=1 Tax=Kordia sp. TaxID=1965332 RepID=UPI003D6A7022
MNYKNLLLLCCLLFSFSCATEKKDSFPHQDRKFTSTVFPKPVGFINDFDAVFSEKEEANLLKLVKKHQAETSNQIAVVTINDMANYVAIEKYSLDLANYWGVGLKGKDNGVLITIHVKNRKLWIQNGDGITSKLTDAETKHIIDTQITPFYKKDDYYGGTYKGIEHIIKELSKADDN